MFADPVRHFGLLTLQDVAVIESGMPYEYDIRFDPSSPHHGDIMAIRVYNRNFKNGSEGRFIMSGNLSLLPGSKGVMVSSGLNVAAIYQGQGHSKNYQTILERIAIAMRRGRIIAYVRDDNATQIQRLQSLGWNKITDMIWEWRHQYWDERDELTTS